MEEKGCKFCHFEDYIGDYFPLEMIQGEKDDFDVFIVDEQNRGKKYFNILTPSADILININYCPNCGRKL